jgi:SAM-dependent methyltransferase
VASLRSLVPAPLRARGRAAIRRVRYRGGKRHCPVCPVCGSQERHRWIWLFLLEHTDLPRRAQRVLHVAPEGCYQSVLRGWRHLDYVTLDLRRPDVMVRADLSALVFGSGAFDFVLCNHVLEHVPDDGAAMREMFRVLRPGGTAVISVPGPSRESQLAPDLAETIEGTPDLSPADRAARFGHPGPTWPTGSAPPGSPSSCGASEPTGRRPSRPAWGGYPGYPIWVCRR